jgi:hypothetical protein
MSALRLLPLFLALLLGVRPAQAQEPEWIRSVVVERAEAHGISSWLLLAIGRCESDRWDPRVLSGARLGPAGEVGPYQLYRWGLLPTFYRLGYTNPLNLYESADFTARMIALGHGRHWSCARGLL